MDLGVNIWYYYTTAYDLSYEVVHHHTVFVGVELTTQFGAVLPKPTQICREWKCSWPSNTTITLHHGTAFYVAADEVRFIHSVSVVSSLGSRLVPKYYYMLLLQMLLNTHKEIIMKTMS